MKAVSNFMLPITMAILHHAKKKEKIPPKFLLLKIKAVTLFFLSPIFLYPLRHILFLKRKNRLTQATFYVS